MTEIIKSSKMKIILAIILNVFLVYGSTTPPIITTHLGKIEGYLDKTITGKTIYSFDGVPYAQPPVGDKRFREPVPKKPWNDIWKAKTIYKCMQYNQYTEPGQDWVIGDEDCLYLNVFTPTLDQNANLDVIVYIHGGGFTFMHGGLLGPQIILDRDVVYVKLNYRLGPLGFLSTEDDVIPGNHGIKDQTMALKWIKENIKYFGGNPNSVTLIGMSAGGVSVHSHYFNKKSRGLFSKGISQSGCILNPWALSENPLEKAKKLGSILGCPSESTKELAKCLKRRPGRQIVNAVKDFQPWLYNPFTPFGPVVDKWASDPVFSDHPYNLLKNKQVTDVPWIVSFTNSEGLYPAADFYPDEQYLEDIETRWDELMPHILDYNYTVSVEDHKAVSQKVRDFYMKDKKMSRSTYMDLIKLVGDRIFLVDIAKAAPLHANAVTSPVRTYHFTYRGSHSQSEYRTKSLKDFGASHGDDTSYIFKIDLDMLATENDKLISQLLIDLVTSYAKTGTPEVPVQWPTVSKKSTDPLTYLKISSPQDVTVVSEQNVGNSDFWKNLPIIENEKLLGIVKDEL